jgi:hypothetical protein
MEGKSTQWGQRGGKPKREQKDVAASANESPKEATKPDSPPSYSHTSAVAAETSRHRSQLSFAVIEDIADKDYSYLATRPFVGLAQVGNTIRMRKATTRYDVILLRGV